MEFKVPTTSIVEFKTRQRDTHSEEASTRLRLNLCRNPDRDKHGPWCFTSNSSIPWDYCDLEHCESPLLSSPLLSSPLLSSSYHGISFQLLSSLSVPVNPVRRRRSSSSGRASLHCFEFKSAPPVPNSPGKGAGWGAGTGVAALLSERSGFSLTRSASPRGNDLILTLHACTPLLGAWPVRIPRSRADTFPPALFFFPTGFLTHLPA
ncbi:hypothetical protein P4O66_002589 [Electrophorus voltai]|uniref:Kringle domain-containing protein n=1 Tax=Electrophorus voltai TaxID=2609070 RepID=A0AAD8YZY0_9TELE|nr:hypothetical protein P4O66_002589 [Electrophorus voltai]